MSGEFEEFNDFLGSPEKVTVSANVVLDEVTKNYTLVFQLMANGFSISDVKPIAKGKVGQMEAQRLADKINNFQRRYNVMKDALEICLPDEIESNEKLDDYQKFTLTEARKAITV